MSAPTLGQIIPRRPLTANVAVPTVGQLFPRAFDVAVAGGPGEGEIGGGGPGSGGSTAPPTVGDAVRDYAGTASGDADSIVVTLPVLAGDRLVAHVHTNKALTDLAGWTKLDEWSYDFPVGSGFTYYVTAWTKTVDADGTLNQTIAVNRASNSWVSSQVECAIYALSTTEEPVVVAQVVPAEKTPASVLTDPTDSALWLVDWAVSSSEASVSTSPTAKYAGERLAGFWGPGGAATVSVDSISNNRVAATVIDLGIIDGGTPDGTGTGTYDGGTP